jgi:hypothetical protein
MSEKLSVEEVETLPSGGIVGASIGVGVRGAGDGTAST